MSVCLDIEMFLMVRNSLFRYFFKGYWILKKVIEDCFFFIFDLDLILVYFKVRS